MSVGDELDDREAQPRPAAAARLVGAAETVEGPIPELARKPGAGVDDVKLDELAPLLGPEHDRAFAVREGVVDQVRERLAYAKWIGLDVEGGLLDAKLPSERVRSVREPCRGVCQQISAPDDLSSDGQRPLVCAGDEE
jgi:hypothetical protein